jgi:transposase
MKGRRPKYTAVFKRQAVLMITEQGLSIPEVARHLAVPQNCLRNCKRNFLRLGNQAFPGQRNLSPEQAKLHRLREENRRLTAERDRLIKAAAYFASLSD